MTFYGDMADTAQKLIAEHGRSVTLRHNDAGVYQVATDTVVNSTTTDTPLIAVFTDFSQKDVDGTLILRGDKKVLLSASDLDQAPQPNDILIDGTDWYHVVEIMSIQPGGTALIYKLQVRK